MPIYGDSLRDATDIFVHQLNSLLSKTLTHTPIQSFITSYTENGVRHEFALVSFPRLSDGGKSITLKTRYGPVGLYITQTLDAVHDENRAPCDCER